MQRTPLKRKSTRRKPARSALQKRKDDTASTYWRRQADAAWSAYIRDRAGGLCAICGEPGGQAHHLIGRSCKRHRHNPDNGLCLCPLHHRFDHRLSAHKAPLAFACWLAETLPEVWAWVQAHRNDYMTEKPDYKVRAEALQPLASPEADA